MNVTTQHPPEVNTAGAMLDVHACAKLLECSAAHFRRLSKDGRAPAPAKLGALLRWPRGTVEAWIASGCPRIEPTADVAP